MEWSKRENLIPNYDLNSLNETYISANFQKIKEKAIAIYNLDGLSDAEIEEALFKLFIMQEENFSDDLDKVVALSYINGFQNILQSDIYTITKLTSSPTSLQANQHLFPIRSRVVKNNYQLVLNTFHQYFCYLSDGKLVNGFNNQIYRQTDPLLPQIASTMNDLFVVPSKIDPKIAAYHLQKEYNYNHNYWLNYFQMLDNKKQSLLSYFESQGKLDALDDFKQISNIYYTYATYYKLSNQIKRKTL